MPSEPVPVTAELSVDEPAGDTAPPPPFLNVTEQRLVEMTQYCCQKLSEYRAQIGIDLYPIGGATLPILSPIGRIGTFAFLRQCAKCEFDGNYLHRRALGGVFIENGPNGGWSMNIPKRFVLSLASKAEDDLIGSDTFCAVMPDNIQNPQEAKLAKQVESRIQEEISESNLREVLAEAMRVAFAEGERCIKLTYKTDKTQYIGDAEVMIDQETGEPFKTPNGDYVYRKDNVLELVVDVKGNFKRIFGGEELAVDQNGQPAEFIQNRLEKEPSVIMPQQPVFELRQRIPITILHKKGLEADGLFCEDFIYDIFQRRLEDCKVMAHSYDIPVEQIEAEYPNSGYTERRSRLSPTGPMARQSMPIYDAGEQLRVGYADNLINIHETYYRCRVNPTDENESWVFLVIDMTNRLPIYAEYLGNMKMKKPPFVLLRGLRSEPGRAYGVGIYADFRDKNLAIDVTFNRLMLKDSKEGSVTFVNPSMIKEVQEGHKLVIGGKEYYTLNQAYPDEIGPKNPPVFRINLNEIDNYGWEILDKLISSGQLEYGVVSIGELEASDSGIAKGGTATATRNIERTGNILQKSSQRMIAGDILKVLDIAVDLVLENMPSEDIAWVPGQQELATLNRDEIRNLPRNLRLTLTRSKGLEALATNAQATQLVLQYLSLPLSQRKEVRSFFVTQLIALEVPDAEERIKEPTDAEIAAEAQQDPMPDMKRTSTATLKDLGPLTPAERSQILEKEFQVKASPPQEVLQLQASEDAKELAAKQPAQPLRIADKTAA